MKKIIILIFCSGSFCFTAHAQQAEKKSIPASDPKPVMNPRAKSQLPDKDPKTEVMTLKDPPSSAIINIPNTPLPKPLMSNMSSNKTAPAPAEIKRPVILQEQPKQH